MKANNKQIGMFIFKETKYRRSLPPFLRSSLSSELHAPGPTAMLSHAIHCVPVSVLPSSRWEHGHGTKVAAKDTGKGVKTGTEKTGDDVKDAVTK
jgi:hypothetical protein